MSPRSLQTRKVLLSLRDADLEGLPDLQGSIGSAEVRLPHVPRVPRLGSLSPDMLWSSSRRENENLFLSSWAPGLILRVGDVSPAWHPRTLLDFLGLGVLICKMDTPLTSLVPIPEVGEVFHLRGPHRARPCRWSNSRGGAGGDGGRGSINCSKNSSSILL